jgi:hypothetical protein
VVAAFELQLVEASEFVASFVRSTRMIHSRALAREIILCRESALFSAIGLNLPQTRVIPYRLPLPSRRFDVRSQSKLGYATQECLGFRARYSQYFTEMSSSRGGF